MSRKEIYFLTDASRRTRKTLVGPPIGSDGAEISLHQATRPAKPIVPLPDRLEAPDLFDFNYFRTAGTVIKESGSQTEEGIRNPTIAYFKGTSNG